MHRTSHVSSCSLRIPPSHHEEALDEVSLVLEHFRPVPYFWLRERSRWIGGRKPSLEAATATSLASGFSSISYCKKDNTILVTYILYSYPTKNKSRRHEMSSTLLKFKVSCQPPFAVSGVYTMDDDSNKKKKLSLFSVVSHLLLQLQKLPAPVETVTAAKNDQQRPVVAGSSQKQKQQQQQQQQQQQVADVAILFLYFAATSRHSTTLCSPVPAPFRNVHNGDVYLQQLLFCLLKDMTNTFVFQTFLLSLGWTTGKNTTLRRIQPRQQQENRNSNSITLCLNIDNGDPSPRFAKKAQQYGTVTVFHGTKLENIWSILNHGLLNLSNTSLEQNGTLMGKGVYFSTSRTVANAFSNHKYLTSSSTQQQPPALKRLLKDFYYCDEGGCRHSQSVAGPSDCYSVSCCAVLEATIPAPPSATSSTTGSTNTSLSMTRKDGKYFVVPNHEDIVLTKLHLTMVIAPRHAMNPKVSDAARWLLLILVLAVLLAACWFR